MSGRTITRTRTIHSAALKGFTNPSHYHSTRPSYPPALFDRLSTLCGEGDVLELGSGTGLLTSGLVPKVSGAYYAQDSSPSMLASLRSSGLPVTTVGGDAGERGGVPLPDKCVGGIVAGQAFHWFRPYACAYMECQRLLRPGGVLAMVWNERDLSEEWARRMETEVIDTLYGEGDPRQQTGEWRDAFEHFLGNYYGNLHKETFPAGASQSGAEAIAGRVASLSVVAAGGEGRVKEVHRNTLEWLKENAPEDPVLRYNTELYWTRTLA